MAHSSPEDLAVTKWQDLHSTFRNYLPWSHRAIRALMWVAVAILGVGSHLLKLNLLTANGAERFLNASRVPNDWAMALWQRNRNKRQ
jgi:hypothetical protein